MRFGYRAGNADFKNISSFVYSQEIEIEWNVVVSINFSIDEQTPRLLDILDKILEADHKENLFRLFQINECFGG